MFIHFIGNFKHLKMEVAEITKLLLESKERLHRYACSLTWDWCNADDLMQDTAVKILRNAGQFRAGSNFYNWACRIMYHTFINGLKHEGHCECVDELSPRTIGKQLFTSKCSVGCDSDTDVCVKDIYDAIDSLPGDTGRVMRLLIEGHKYVEISLMTRLPLGTVKTHIRLSREILKRVLSDNEK